MLSSQRLAQYNLIMRHGNTEYAQAVLARPLSDDRQESKLWTEIGMFLASVEALDDADQAFVRALRLEPTNRAARLARRKLKIARPLDPVSLEFLSERLMADHELAQKPNYLSTTPVTGGFSAMTEALSRHVFACNKSAEQRHLHVISKEFTLRDRNKGALPREIEVAKRASGVVCGETLRLPRYYGHCRNALGRHVLFMESVVIGKQESKEKIRAHALSELASISLDRCRDFVDFLCSLATKRRFCDFSEVLDSFCAPVDLMATKDLMCLYRKCQQSVQSWKDRAEDLPLGLAHGDAQSPNLLIDVSGRMVLLDIGGMQVAPIGFDLATLVAYSCREREFEAAYCMRFEENALHAFLEGTRRWGAIVTERQVRTAYALGHMRFVAGLALRISKRGKDQMLLPKGMTLPAYTKRMMEAIKFSLHSTLRNLSVTGSI